MFELKKIEAEWKARMHKALSFDGKDDYMVVPHSDSLSFEGDFTICLWMKNNDPSPDVVQRIYNKRITYKQRELDAHIISGKLYVLIRNDAEGEDRLQVEVSYPYKTWKFLTVRREGNTLTVFLDATEVGSDTGVANITNTKPLYIATRDGTAHFLNGLIAHVCIYNRALSPSEIKYLYHNPFDPIDPEHLVLWLNPAGIDVANSKWWDMSGKGNHGTIYGATEVSLVEEEVKVK